MEQHIRDHISKVLWDYNIYHSKGGYWLKHKEKMDLMERILTPPPKEEEPMPPLPCISSPISATPCLQCTAQNGCPLYLQWRSKHNVPLQL